jgi:hypothetical protein
MLGVSSGYALEHELKKKKTLLIVEPNAAKNAGSTDCQPALDIWLPPTTRPGPVRPHFRGAHNEAGPGGRRVRNPRRGDGAGKILTTLIIGPGQLLVNGTTATQQAQQM